MLRTILIAVLCLALATMGVSGMHAHIPGGDSAGHSQDRTGDGLKLYGVLDAQHLPAHDEHRDIDVDPVPKAFGKHLVLKFFVLVAFVLAGILAHQFATACRRLLAETSPSVRRLCHFFLPPATAPPGSAH